jgi:uncharacterized membrane protein
MIHKTAESKFELLHHGGPDKRVKVADGAVVGSLVGVLGGPIGLIIGLLTGMAIGSTANSIAAYDFSDEFLNEVNRKIAIGTLAIVMDVQEDVECMIDNNLEDFHGSTIHENLGNPYDELEDKKWKDLGIEIKNEKQELAKALGRDKAPIRKKIDQLRKQREERRNKRKTAVADWKNQLHDKIELLDQKIKSSNGKVREKLSAHREHFMQKLEIFNSFAEDRMF